MRPRSDLDQVAIIRAAQAIVAASVNDREIPMIVVAELRARDWASITFTGIRHELDLALAGDGGACATALAAIIADLPEAEVPLPGRILADLAVTPAGEAHRFTIAALIVDD